MKKNATYCDKHVSSRKCFFVVGGMSRTPSNDPIPSRYVPKYFRCPNTIVLYINHYLSTISRLLVMSVISSGTPNNIRSPNHITHITRYHQWTLSVRTLRVRELCRHDRHTNSRTWMPILAPTYSMKIFIGRTVITTYVIPFVNRYVTYPRFDRRYLHT